MKVTLKSKQEKKPDPPDVELTLHVKFKVPPSYFAYHWYDPVVEDEVLVTPLEWTTEGVSEYISNIISKGDLHDFVQFLYDEDYGLGILWEDNFVIDQSLDVEVSE